MSTANKIKVVIWDLDETFWEGTLSEEGIRYSEPNHQIVDELARRGIVSTICSKNSPERVEEALATHGASHLFVFADVSWQPKGPRIAALLERMGLRSANALFIDDNPMNREEAAYYLPELRVAGPEVIASLLDDPSLTGSPDPELTRLEQYRILERKERDRDTQGADNREFLRQSRIVVELADDPLRDLDRVVELVERANQLNFTKRRDDRIALQALLSLPEVAAGTVRVSDRYGDYGLCGFWATRGGELLHFVFSCRILDMGIEQWLHERLGAPPIDIVGEVASTLPGDGPVDWIQEGALELAPPPSEGPKILMKGGCDLAQVADYLGSDARFHLELNGVTPDGVPIHAEHTELILQRESWADPAGKDLVESLPFLTADAVKTAFFDSDAAAVIYSPLMDYTQGLYVHRDLGLVIPYGDFRIDITDRAHWPRLLGLAGPRGLDEDFLADFSAAFRFDGEISPERFGENLRRLRALLPRETVLILLNGAEVALEHEVEVQRHEHHRRLNAVVDALVDEDPRTFLCDVRSRVSSVDDVTNNIRHYRRHVYHDVAEEIRGVLAAELGLRFSRLRRAFARSRVAAVDTLRRAKRLLTR